MSTINPYKTGKEFKDRNKAVFLAALKTKFPNHAPISISPFKYFIRGTAFGVAFMAVIGGISVYADQKNVGPESPLYPLKRSSEAVSLALTNQNEKSAFHLKLANRRLAEIKSVRKTNPSSSQVESLTKDLSDEVRDSIETIKEPENALMPSLSAPAPIVQEARLNSAARGFSAQSFSVIESSTQVSGTSNPPSVETLNTKSRTICESWRDIFDSKKEGINLIIKDNTRVAEKFEKKCGSFLGNQGDKTNEDSSSSSSENHNKDNKSGSND